MRIVSQKSTETSNKSVTSSQSPLADSFPHMKTTTLQETKINRVLMIFAIQTCRHLLFQPTMPRRPLFIRRESLSYCGSVKPMFYFLFFYYFSEAKPPWGQYRHTHHSTRVVKFEDWGARTISSRCIAFHFSTMARSCAIPISSFSEPMSQLRSAFEFQWAFVNSVSIFRTRSILRFAFGCLPFYSSYMFICSRKRLRATYGYQR